MMAADRFLEGDYRLLAPEAFDFILTNELKRAVRSQNFVTLLLIEPSAAEPPSAGAAEHERLVRHIAGLVSREVRETDLLSQTEPHHLSVVLLDADLPSSILVIDRLMSRFEHYEFSRPIEINVGAACCPTNGADAESLRRVAQTRLVNRRRDARGNASGQ
jgi:GGDEF domain-containing protein